MSVCNQTYYTYLQLYNSIFFFGSILDKTTKRILLQIPENVIIYCQLKLDKAAAENTEKYLHFHSIHHSFANMYSCYRKFTYFNLCSAYLPMRFTTKP